MSHADQAKALWLDAGHGGDNPGAIVENVREATLNELFVNKLGAALEELGLPIIYARKSKETVLWPKRVARAARVSPRLILSVHHDFSTETSKKAGWAPRGPRVYHRGNSELFEQFMAQTLLNSWPAIPARSTGKVPVVPTAQTYPNALALLEHYKNHPTLLLEVDFMSNREFFMMWPKWHATIIKKIAPAIAQAWMIKQEGGLA